MKKIDLFGLTVYFKLFGAELEKFFKVFTATTEWRSHLNFFLSSLVDKENFVYTSGNLSILNCKNISKSDYIIYLYSVLDFLEYLKDIMILFKRSGSEIVYKNVVNSILPFELLLNKCNDLKYLNEFLKILNVLMLELFLNHYNVRENIDNFKSMNFSVILNDIDITDYDFSFDFDNYILLNINSFYKSVVKGCGCGRIKI